MKIFITGGSGFIGRQLTHRLVKLNHQVTILSRSPASNILPDVDNVIGDPTLPGDWQEIMKTNDAVINLAGASIFCRWNRTNRQRIIDGRVISSRNISAALNDTDSQIHTLINGSAIGYYGDTGNIEVTEKTGPGSDFLAEVTGKWEAAALKCSSARVVCCRFGVVLGRSGGSLLKMLPAFKAGFGSALGNGKQWFPWIHIDDLVAAICFVLNHKNLAGPVNLTAPEPLTNSQFSRSLARALKRPYFMPAIPSFILKLFLGEAAALLLNSNKVRPNILKENGFTFTFTDIDSALADLVRKK
jgi:uncharacterized protein (TIGR01777 family)